jgi:alkanesulfonate monooxygenase SsuD/methylene tetrahydromethanopterin reductase-like flavin-dependent oxidoreductase (luciferase family)
MVTSPNFRHPATSANATLTLDAISEGRFPLGVGAGGPAVGNAAGAPTPLRQWGSACQAAGARPGM